MWLASTVFFTSLVERCLSFELQPIGSPLTESGRHVARDDDFSALDLLSTESFFWGGMSEDLFNDTERKKGI